MIAWLAAGAIVGLVAWRAAVRQARHQAEEQALATRLAAGRSSLDAQRLGQRHDFSKAVSANRRAEAADALRQKVAAKRAVPKLSKSNVTPIDAKRKVG